MLQKFESGKYDCAMVGTRTSEYDVHLAGIRYGGIMVENKLVFKGN
jgi:hypothetical protein